MLVDAINTLYITQKTLFAIESHLKVAVCFDGKQASVLLLLTKGY